MFAKGVGHPSYFVKFFVNVIERPLVDVLKIESKIEMRFCFSN